MKPKDYLHEPLTIDEVWSFVGELLEVVNRRGLRKPTDPYYAWEAADQEVLDDAGIYLGEYEKQRKKAKLANKKPKKGRGKE